LPRDTIEGIGGSIMAGETKDCYGKMFPPVIRQPDNVTMAGKVPSYHVEHSGVMATDRSVMVDEKAWRQCVLCEEHESCYRLSIGKLLLEIALTA
jgi:hypothetical protein